MWTSGQGSVWKLCPLERREKRPECDFNTETDAEYEATTQKEQNRSYQLLCPTRNVLEQCPQMTRMPRGWCWGSGTSLLMCTDPKLIMRLLGKKEKRKGDDFIWMLSETANFEIIQFSHCIHNTPLSSTESFSIFHFTILVSGTFPVFVYPVCAYQSLWAVGRCMCNHICNITTCILNVVLQFCICNILQKIVMHCICSVYNFSFIIYELCLLHSCYTHGSSSRSSSYLKLPHPSITLIEARG